MILKSVDVKYHTLEPVNICILWFKKNRTKYYKSAVFYSGGSGSLGSVFDVYEEKVSLSLIDEIQFRLAKEDDHW